jgi:hypothetical protein
MVVLDRGSIAMRGPAATVLDDPRLADFGVEPPAKTRLARDLQAAGVEFTADLAGALG